MLVARVTTCNNEVMLLKFESERGSVTVPTVAITVLSALAILSVLTLSSTESSEAGMKLEASEYVVLTEQSISVTVLVEASVPVNVFAGELLFNSSVLQVDSISYNTSIADLWAEKPWYSNGEGTLNFAGGTTQAGGFTGNGTLITVNFKAISPGAGTIAFKDPRILLYDGLGTDAKLNESIDTVISVEPKDSNLLVAEPKSVNYMVVSQPPSTDLNHDGKQTLADVSIFMLHMTNHDERFDFNLDGKVGLKDLNILLGAR